MIDEIEVHYSLVNIEQLDPSKRKTDETTKYACTEISEPLKSQDHKSMFAFL